MKILATSDIHQMISKWKELVKICQKDKFDVVALSGDLFPKDTYILGQLSFMKNIKKYAEKINATGAKIVVMLGNDDNQLLIPSMEEEHGKLWYYIPEKVVEIDGIEFAGMPYVPDYPFGYKFWCRGEFRDNLRIDPIQNCESCLVDSNNKFCVIEDYPKYLASQKTIHEILEETASKVKNINKSVWLIHAPPSDLFLDVCARGVKVGSNAVLQFVKKYQPLLTIHGHIHESPEYNGNKWYQHEGKTMCVQGGQIGFDLHYSTINIENGEVKDAKHSIYR